MVKLHNITQKYYKSGILLTTTMHTSGDSTHVVTMYKLHVCVVAHLGHTPA